MSSSIIKAIQGSAPRAPLFYAALFNLSVFAVLAASLALVGAGLVEPDALMLAAIAVTAIAWAIRNASGTRASKMAQVALLSGLFPYVVAVFLLRAFVAEPFAIPSGSMMPTLQEGDFIAVNKHAYGLRMPLSGRKIIETRQPERGDIVVFRSPANPKMDYIKRVVGVPGDLVIYLDKRLVINGQPLKYAESPVFGGFSERWTARYGLTESLNGREHSILLEPDTPAYVPKHVQAFPGSANCSYRAAGFACRVPEGHFFVLGDNRDASHDSRYWGFVPVENLVGKASLIWMNFKRPGRIGWKID